MYKLDNKESLKRLERLREEGVVDSDLSSEMIRKNINLYGKTLENPLSKTYKKGMENLSQAYGVPDTYAKLIAHEIEYRELKKIYGNTVSDDELFSMASEIVRDVMPSYSVAAPGARMLSRLPVGTYALFPSEMVRTSKNIVIHSLTDLIKGSNELIKGNIKVGARLIKRGVRRGTGFAATTYGLESYVNANNELLTETPNKNISASEQNEINKRVIESTGPSFARGANHYLLQGFKEIVDSKTGQRSIIGRYANSAQYDAADFGKVGVRLTGRILGGDMLSSTTIGDALEGLGKSILGPYTSPKFVADGLINIAASIIGHGDLFSEEQPGLSWENIKRTFFELARTLEPGTSQAVRAYFDQMKASEVAEIARNSYGYPLTMDDMNSWLMTGQRTVTNDINKSIGYSIYKDMRQLDLSDKSFTSYLRQLKPEQMTPTIAEDIINEYRESMQVKRENYNKLKEKLNLYSLFSYQDTNGNPKSLGVNGIFRAVSGPNMEYQKNGEEALLIMKAPFSQAVLNPIDNRDLINVLQEKFGKRNPLGIIGKLSKAYAEEVTNQKPEFIPFD